MADNDCVMPCFTLCHSLFIYRVRQLVSRSQHRNVTVGTCNSIQNSANTLLQDCRDCSSMQRATAFCLLPYKCNHSNSYFDQLVWPRFLGARVVAPPGMLPWQTPPQLHTWSCHQFVPYQSPKLQPPAKTINTQSRSQPVSILCCVIMSHFRVLCDLLGWTVFSKQRLKWSMGRNRVRLSKAIVQSKQHTCKGAFKYTLPVVFFLFTPQVTRPTRFLISSKESNILSYFHYTEIASL